MLEVTKRYVHQTFFLLGGSGTNDLKGFEMLQ